MGRERPVLGSLCHDLRVANRTRHCPLTLDVGWSGPRGNRRCRSPFHQLFLMGVLMKFRTRPRTLRVDALCGSFALASMWMSGTALAQAPAAPAAPAKPPAPAAA